jgi:hypothetical protein
MSDSKNKVKIVTSSRRSKRTTSARSETESSEENTTSLQQLKKRPAPPTYTPVTAFKVDYHMKPCCGCDGEYSNEIFLNKKKAIAYARDTAKKMQTILPLSEWPSEFDDFFTEDIYMSNLELFESGEMTDGTLWMIDMSHVSACGCASHTMELTECEMVVKEGEDGYLYDMKEYKIQA